METQATTHTRQLKAKTLSQTEGAQAQRTTDLRRQTELSTTKTRRNEQVNTKLLVSTKHDTYYKRVPSTIQHLATCRHVLRLENATLEQPKHGCEFPARRGVSPPASAWVGVPSSQEGRAGPNSSRVETMSDKSRPRFWTRNSRKIVDPKLAKSDVHEKRQKLEIKISSIPCVSSADGRPRRT